MIENITSGNPKSGLTIQSIEKTSLKELGEEINRLDGEKANTTEFLETIIRGALSLKSSDIHLEAVEEGAKFRLRIDGVLHDVSGLGTEVYRELINRIKVLSGLKLNIRESAQDGRFTIERGDKADIEIRVSLNPSEFGETIVLRLLDPESIALGVADLGLRPDDGAIADLELKRPNGMILVTGPTGSGKTTTLYAFLKAVANSEIKIITIEDPIEYHLEGIEQTQVNEETDYDFHNGLRSLLRQDPDVILVGEIRDAETAEVAMSSALTGHLVFSTLHTNSSLGAIPRLIDMGIKTSVIGPALNLVIGQRLVRKLCDHCKEKVEIDSDLQSKIKSFVLKLAPRVNKKDYEEVVLYKAKGCEECNSIGYKGRIGIFELFQLDKEMQGLISEKVTELDIEKMALAKGFISHQADGVLKSIKGITTLEEIERTTGPISW